jgi:hypothetical protein
VANRPVANTASRSSTTSIVADSLWIDPDEHPQTALRSRALNYLGCEASMVLRAGQTPLEPRLER